YYQELVQEGQPGEELAMVNRRIGELFLQFEEPENAINPFQNVLKMTSGNDEVRYNLGIAFFRTGQEQKAIDSLRRAVELAPESEKYRLALAEVLYQSGYRKRALAQFDRVMKVNSGNLEARYMSGYIHYTRGELDRASERFQNLIADTGEDSFLADLYQAMGSIYIKREDYSSARTSLRQALEHSEKAELYYNLGLAFIHQQEWEKAATSLQHAAEMNGENSSIPTALGFVFDQMGMYERARSQFEKALTFNPGNTRARWNLKQVKKELEGD
ncbi:MAG: tetratricopeptide repeat protein, partial [bacterium]